MLFILPFDVIWIIRSFMPWKQSAKLVSREWLNGALFQRPKARKWAIKVRLYSYMKVFGQSFVNMSWHRFCSKLKVTRRSRNTRFRLTWRAAAQKHFETRCKGCGNSTRAQVFGWPICQRCCHNSTLKYCYMVSVALAVSKGANIHELRRLHYHGSRMGTRLRFWTDVKSCIH